MKNDESQELWAVVSKGRRGDLFMTATAESQDAAEDIAYRASEQRGVTRYVYRLIPCCKFCNTPHREPL